jgi:hypothetical protein
MDGQRSQVAYQSGEDQKNTEPRVNIATEKITGKHEKSVFLDSFRKRPIKHKTDKYKKEVIETTENHLSTLANPGGFDSN